MSGHYKAISVRCGALWIAFLGLPSGLSALLIAGPLVMVLIAVRLLVAVRAFGEHIPQLEALGDFLSARGTENLEKPGTASRS